MECNKAEVFDAPLLAVLVLVVFWEVPPLLTVLVSVVCIWEFELGQLHPMCPWHLHLKHLPSQHSWVISTSDRAALAQICPGVVSMALLSLAKCCCHCC
jgi:hypothetical protein